jgi:F420 biosynthesis protein FbiB-like protein
VKILDAIKSRRSVREYASRRVSSKVLFRILEAARWAPSAHNAQPWRFVTVRDAALKRKLAEAMAKRWDEDMSKDNVPPEKREKLARASIERFTRAPVVVIACLTMVDMDRYPDERRQKIEYVMAVQSLAAAIENMLLAAHAEGLGSCWFCAPLFCQDTVRKILNIPSHVEPQALITMGYPIDKPDPPPRKPLEKIVHQDYWR